MLKRLGMGKHSGLLQTYVNYNHKMFITLASTNDIKHFTVIIYNYWVFVVAKPFQLSLMLVSKSSGLP
jgi:hypothetical protein